MYSRWFKIHKKNEVEYKRARHVITENQRVIKAANLLKITI